MGLWSSIKKIGSSVVKGISSVGKGLLGSIPGALIGGAVDLGSAYLGNKIISQPNADEAYAQSKEAAALAFQRSYDTYKRRYQDTMADMEAAGLNPILAAGSGGFNVGTGPQVSSAQGYMAQPVNISASSAYENMKSGELKTAQRGETEQNTKKIMAETKKVRQDTLLSLAATEKTRAEKGLVNAQEKKTLQEVRNLEKQWWNLVQEFNLISNQAYAAASQNRLNQSKVKEVEALTLQINKVTEKLQAELKMLNKMASAYESDIGGVLGYVKAIMDALNINLGAVVGMKR